MDMLLVALTQPQIVGLRQFAVEMYPEAFLIFSGVSEARGPQGLGMMRAARK